MRGPEMDDTQLSCKTCNVIATSAGQLSVHLGGKKHKRLTSNAEKGMNLASLGSGNGEPLNCELCNVEVASPLHQQYHLRGQKHQRKEKQNRLMDASEATAKKSIGYLLSDEDSVEGPSSPASPPEAAQPPEKDSEQHSHGNAKQDAENEDEVKTILGDVHTLSLNQPQPGAGDSNGGQALSALSSASSLLQMRLVSPFEEFPGPEDLPKQDNSNTSAEYMAASNQGVWPSEATARQGMHPEASFCSHPDSYNGIDMQALGTGGSFSSPALYFCPVCGIKATSQPNLEEHLQGRRHARRLQYLSRKALEQQNAQMSFRGPSGPTFAMGSLMLPTSMDFTSHLGRAARIPDLQRRLSDRRSTTWRPPQTMHSQHYSFDSVKGLHSRRESAHHASTLESESLRSAKKSAESNDDSVRSTKKSVESESATQSLEATVEQQSNSHDSSSEHPNTSSFHERRGAGNSLSAQSAAFQPQQDLGDEDRPINGLEDTVNSVPGDPTHASPVMPDQKAAGHETDATRSSSVSSPQTSSVSRSQGRPKARPHPPRAPAVEAQYSQMLPRPFGPDWQGWGMHPPRPMQTGQFAYAPVPYFMVPQAMPPGQTFPYFAQPPFLQGPAYPYHPSAYHQAPPQGWQPVMQAGPPNGNPSSHYPEQYWGQAPPVRADSDSPYVCQVCDVSLKNLDALKHHVRGKQHLRKL